MDHQDIAYNDEFIATIEADCPSDWAVDTDEVGNLVYCEIAIGDYLQLDVA